MIRKRMSMFLQLCYASRRTEFQNDLLQDLSEILATARAFNYSQNIYGVLYYAEGIYFQCLEGEPEIVKSLFDNICKDSRHHDIHRFPDREIEKIHFSQWSMKYVNQHGKVAKFFEKRGFDHFVPHDLDAENVVNLIDLLFKLQDSDEHAKNKMGLNNRGYQNFF